MDAKVRVVARDAANPTIDQMANLVSTPRSSGSSSALRNDDAYISSRTRRIRRIVKEIL